MAASYFSAGCSPPPGLHNAPPIGSIPCMILFCTSICVLKHTVLSTFGLYLDLHFQGVCSHPAEQISIKIACCILGVIEGHSKIQNKELLVLFIAAVLTNFHFLGESYSCSPSKLYQDFLCFSMMYTCNRSLLPKSFPTFSM